jgi:hypothetical protein
LFQDKLICYDAFRIVYGVSSSTIYSNPAVEIKDTSSEKCDAIRQYLTELASWHDFMPDSKEIHLPYTTKHQVFDLFMNRVENGDYPAVESICLSYFRQIWRQHCNHIKVRKCIRFAKCSVCVRLREKMAMTSDFTENEKLKKVFFNHLTKMKADRKQYADNVELATNPETSADNMSIIIDGAYWGTYGSPYFHEIDKSTDKGFKIPNKLTGVKVHGKGICVFTIPCNLPTDPNHIINCLHKTLSLLFENVSNNNGNWPSNLFLQVIIIEFNTIG